MSSTLKTLAGVGLAILVAACGGSQKAEPPASTPEATEKAPAGLEDMAKRFQQLGEAAKEAAETKPVPPVGFRELQPLFPDLNGWEKGTPTGEQMSVPVSVSVAEINYSNGDASIHGKITDSGFNQMLLAPFLVFMTAGYEQQTEHGYEKSATVAGQPGWEKWDDQDKSGEVNAIVAKRFVVTFDGRGIDDTAILHQLAEKVDMARLAAMGSNK